MKKTYKIAIVTEDSTGAEIDRVETDDPMAFDYKAYTDRMPITVHWYGVTEELENVVHYDNPKKR